MPSPILTLMVLLLLLRTVHAEAAGCEEPPRWTVVELTTLLHEHSNAPIESRVWADGTTIGRTNPLGRCAFHADPCTSAEWIEVKPTSPNYCPEMRLCARGVMPIEIVSGCSIVTALEEGDAGHIPWAGELLFAVSGNIGAEFAIEDGGQINELSNAARILYAEAEFFDTARVARDLTLVLLELGEEDAARSPAILQLDAAFRAAGLEPAGAGSPLLAFSEEFGGFIPTQIGQQALELLDPALEFSAVEPIVLSDVAFATLEKLAIEPRAILHPAAVADLTEYLSIQFQ